MEDNKACVDTLEETVWMDNRREQEDMILVVAPSQRVLSRVRSAEQADEHRQRRRPETVVAPMIGQ